MVQDMMEVGMGEGKLRKFHYHYVAVMAAGAAMGLYVRGEHHPHSLAGEQELLTRVRRVLQQATGQLLVDVPVVVLSVTELPPEVACERWPGDLIVQDVR